MGKRLDQLTKEAEDKFNKTLKEAVVSKDSTEDAHLSSSVLSEKLTTFQKNLEEREAKFFTVTDELKQAKSDIVNCLVNNKDKPLNCWDEVKSFEKLVSQIN